LAVARSQTERIGIRMTETNSYAGLIGRRSELMAELFLQDLKPKFLARPTEDFGFDFLVSFNNPKGGVNTFGVEVKGTDRDISSSFAIDKGLYRRLVGSNVPGFLIVANVKQNRLFYSWPKADRPNVPSGAGKVLVPVTEIDQHSKKELRKKLIN
jgi:hypothetical protein